MKEAHRKVIFKRVVAAAVFLLIFVLLVLPATPNSAVAWVCFILLLTIYLFAFEVVGVDVAAISIMVLLGLTGLLGPWAGLPQPLVPSNKLFTGFSSNAVISIIAVMIIGAGLDRTGVMSKVASVILRVGGSTEKRIIPIISGTVAFISSFMQNVGAAALFLPVVSRISARTNLPMSRLLMPMGFCAILGGTVTMVGSSPLILLNDLILTSNTALPQEHQMATFALFDVTPIGLALVTTGIVYFVLAGRYVLPTVETAVTKGADTLDHWHRVYGLSYDLREIPVPAGSLLVGKTPDDFEPQHKVRVLALRRGSDETRIGAAGLGRDTTIAAGDMLGVLGSGEAIAAFCEHFALQPDSELSAFSEVLSPAKAGIAELVIPPVSSLIGRSARDLWMRKTYGVSVLAIHRQGKTIREGEGVRNLPLAAGDALVVHVAWEALAHLQSDRDFVVVTTEFPHEELRPHKVGFALLFFVIALGLILFTELRLSVALLTGALGMILTGVLHIEEAYKAVSWKTVFLLASLIPLGLAVETSGTAAWIAQETIQALGDVPTWVLQSAIAVLATFFTLVMSNVGATVLLVPLAVNIAVATGASPALFALTVALATSNSFLIPTHQVNALIMGPAGYRVPDFIRAGGIMTVLFLVVLITMLNIVF